MGMCFLYGNGGSGLRLRIFGGTNAPLNPKNNDIWVKTSTAIGAWELSDKTLPISWAMPSGYVYIKGDFTGSYDYRETTGLALDVPGNHDCTMYARLTRCIQYDGSAWASKDAYIYHDGWHQFGYSWNGELFDNGNQYEYVTGGWTVSGDTTSLSPALQGDSYSGNVSITTKSAVDLTRFSTLNFTGYGYGSNSGGQYSASWGVQTNDGSTLVSGTYQRSSDATSSIDISSISGNYYIKFWVSGSRGNKISITKVWLT